MNNSANDRTIQGALLRMERLRQNREQKEVCFGICVPSYLSKIEHGTVCPDEEIVRKLFAKLGIVWQDDEKALEELRRKVAAYFHNCSYAFETKELYEELCRQELTLRYSGLVIDWLLIQGMETMRYGGTQGGDLVKAAKRQETMELLKALEDHMDRKQRAYYLILRFREQPQAQAAQEWCLQAVEVLNNCFAYMTLAEFYYLRGDYSAICRLENRFTAIALEEGNTYYLADYYFMKGSAYACLNMESLMMENYQKSIHFLQNTGWGEELSAFYYNIGATYLSLKKYNEAIAYLEKSQDSALKYHKLALAHIRGGAVEAGKEFLEKMKNEILKENSCDETDLLRYEEACAECQENFLEDPEYLELLEKLIVSVKKNYPFGHLYFYREVVIEAYKRQRKYKKALEFEEEISQKVAKMHF